MMRPRPSTSAAFTLVETLLAVSLMAIVLGGVASAMALASRGLRPADTGPQATTAAALALDRLTADLRHASELSLDTSSGIRLQMTVPDITGDSAADTVQWRWAGAGNALERRVNTRETESVIAAVQGLRFAVSEPASAGTRSAHAQLQPSSTGSPPLRAAVQMHRLSRFETNGAESAGGVSIDIGIDGDGLDVDIGIGGIRLGL